MFICSFASAAFQVMEVIGFYWIQMADAASMLGKTICWMHIVIIEADFTLMYVWIVDCFCWPTGFPSWRKALSSDSAAVALNNFGM